MNAWRSTQKSSCLASLFPVRFRPRNTLLLKIRCDLKNRSRALLLHGRLPYAYKTYSLLHCSFAICSRTALVLLLCTSCCSSSSDTWNYSSSTRAYLYGIYESDTRASTHATYVQHWIACNAIDRPTAEYKLCVFFAVWQLLKYAATYTTTRGDHRSKGGSAFSFFVCYRLGACRYMIYTTRACWWRCEEIRTLADSANSGGIVLQSYRTRV